jgi:hypothetical protein
MQPMVYLVQRSVEYSDRPLERLTTCFHQYVAIPMLIVLGRVAGSRDHRDHGHGHGHGLDRGLVRHCRDLALFPRTL